MHIAQARLVVEQKNENMNWKHADSRAVLTTADRPQCWEGVVCSSTDIIVATPSSISSCWHLHPQQQQQQQQGTANVLKWHDSPSTHVSSISRQLRRLANVKLSALMSSVFHVSSNRTRFASYRMLNGISTLLPIVARGAQKCVKCDGVNVARVDHLSVN